MFKIRVEQFLITILRSWSLYVKKWRREDVESSPNVSFLEDYGPAHKSHAAMKAIRDLGFELLQHFLYSPDLAPSVMSFANWKKGWKRRGETEEVWFAEQNKIVFVVIGVSKTEERMVNTKTLCLFL